MNPKVMEAWFTLMTEAMRGREQAQAAFKAVPTGDAEAWQKWMSKFMPGVAPDFSADGFEDQLAEWYRLMGVVPRARYLEALEKSDILQRRLEKAEATIEKLRAMVEGKGETTDEAKQVLDTWSTMLNETLKTQTEWMRAWTETEGPASDAETAGAGSEDK